MIYLTTNNLTLFQNKSFTKCNLDKALDYFKNKESIEIDTETEGLDCHINKILTIQLGDKDNQFVIDWLSLTKEQIKKLKTLLESKTLILQNAKFDLQFLYKVNIIPTDIEDTFLAEKVLTTGILGVKRSLDALTNKYLGFVLDKSVRNDILKYGLTPEVVEYAAKDVMYLGAILDKQKIELEKLDLMATYKLERRFVCALAYIEFCGFAFDKEKWNEKCEKDLSDRQKQKEILDSIILNDEVLKDKYLDKQLDLFSEDTKLNINWDSGKQVVPIMEHFKVDVINKEGKKSVDQTVLRKSEKEFPIVQEYIKYSKLSKLVTSFGINYFKFINKGTNRVHTTFNQILDTGRISSGNVRALKPNLQQVPADHAHRGCFVAAKDKTLVVADYSSQESRILADRSQETNLVDFYLNGEADLHTYTAKLVYPELRDLSTEEVKTKHKDKRQLMKSLNFALAYGGNELTISNNANIPIEQATQIVSDYFLAFDGLKAYFETAKKQPVKDGYVLIDSVSGRKSFIMGYESTYKVLHAKIKAKGYWEKYREEKNNNTEYFQKELYPQVKEYFKIKGAMERKGMNFTIQGTAASMTKLALINLFKHILERGHFNEVKIVNAVHDEICVEVPLNEAEYYSDKVKQFMEEAGSVFCKTIPITSEPCITNYWEH